MSNAVPEPTTTDAGIPVPSDGLSLTVGPDGPILLQDHYLIEQIANFNRERIPERQPHAKGGGAFGHFQVTNDVGVYTRAAVFAPGTKTDTLIRFSTVAGERGTPDTWRDPRGFSLRFYTSEGNLDIVGNNTPIFFIRDPLKFQHFIRSQKRRAANNLRDNDMQWDFWTLVPESAHMLSLTLDRNVTDYHTEIEQAAFEPNNQVSGTGLSPDKMLLARGFAYADAHRARLGVNYKQIPVNSPRAEVHSYSKDGVMRINNVSDPVYAPNSYGGPQADPLRAAEARWHSDGDMVRAAYTLHAEDDDYGQAATMVREVLDDAARDRLVSNVAGHLRNGVSEPVLLRAFEYWKHIDKATGEKIETAVRSEST
ncbi:catalase [Nocardia sp. CA-129566]|uniref:catalase n=1 Tax=Nocardia sp. CA-129566 TaxID=3239976 RepID=UPI003D95ADD8